ncbi:MAG: hypothetical protein IKH78_09690 [Ruminococcus sp.]|nr:hypothetical protein [Ruminococcus sp.]MBR6968789.1 hypothetical protein [Ruminococcus sp.]
MDSRTIWSQTRDRLISALVSLGYPAELGNVIAEHIGSPKGMERMISYLCYVRPERVELIVDEMLAIKSDIDRWREKKECERANTVYNNVLNYGLDDDDSGR